MKAPEPGDVVYVDTELHVSHGADDVRGGKATVSAVRMQTSLGREVPFVEVEQNRGTFHNWELLEAKQAALASEFGETWSRPDPDLRPQFNELGPGTERKKVPIVYLLWLVALFVYVLDRWSKTLVLGSFMPGESRTVVPHLLWWTYVQNTHGAFGLFGNSPFLLIVLALIVLGIFAYAFREAVQHSNVVRIAFGMIAGGAIGNIVDRFQHKWVVDFIDFRTIWPNVFNVADACITCGVVLLVLASLRREKRA